MPFQIHEFSPAVGHWRLMREVLNEECTAADVIAHVDWLHSKNDAISYKVMQFEPAPVKMIHFVGDLDAGFPRRSD